MMDEQTKDNLKANILEIWATTVKHLKGKHNQASHGRATGARTAYRQGYSSARAGGASVSEARVAGRTASGEVKAQEREQRKGEVTKRREEKKLSKGGLPSAKNLYVGTKDNPPTQKQIDYAKQLLNGVLVKKLSDSSRTPRQIENNAAMLASGINRQFPFQKADRNSRNEVSIDKFSDPSKEMEVLRRLESKSVEWARGIDVSRMDKKTISDFIDDARSYDALGLLLKNTTDRTTTQVAQRLNQLAGEKVYESRYSSDNANHRWLSPSKKYVRPDIIPQMDEDYSMIG